MLQTARYTDPRDACAAITEESYKLWLELVNRTDDITIIIVQIKGLSNVCIIECIPSSSFPFYVYFLQPCLKILYLYYLMDLLTSHEKQQGIIPSKEADSTLKKN
jgi:hypothetical protein